MPTRDVIAVPLGERRSASVQALKRGGDYGTAATFRQTRGASDLGLDYRLAAETGTRYDSIEGRVSYQSRSEPPTSRRSGSTATTRCGPA